MDKWREKFTERKILLLKNAALPGTCTRVLQTACHALGNANVSLPRRDL